MKPLYLKRSGSMGPRTRSMGTKPPRACRSCFRPIPTHPGETHRRRTHSDAAQRKHYRNRGGALQRRWGWGTLPRINWITTSFLPVEPRLFWKPTRVTPGTEGNNLVIRQPWAFIITIATVRSSFFVQSADRCGTSRGAVSGSTAFAIGTVFPCLRPARTHVRALAYLAVDGQGRLSNVSDLAELLRLKFRRGRGLVSLAHINNEIGTIMNLEVVGTAPHYATRCAPINVIAEANRKRDAAHRVYLHTDAVQSPHDPSPYGAHGGSHPVTCT